MRRVIGIVVLAATVIAGIILLLTGNLGHSQVLQGVSRSGGTGSVQWTESDTMVAYYPNWFVLALLGVCFVGGVLCLVWPSRR
jgi:hypothetical protein